MLAEFETWNPQPATPYVEAIAAVRGVQAVSNEQPIILGVTPVARVNPFQALLYKQFPEQGFAVVPINDTTSFDRLADLCGRYQVAVHLHWLSVVLAEATNVKQAKDTLDAFKVKVERFTAKGGHIVWTVHNVLPHDAQFFDLEAELRGVVADAATVVHVMSQETLEAVADIVTIDPAKVVFGPHPSYRGAYPDYVTREEARVTLGIEPNEKVFVLFGAIKPYKGLSTLLAAFDDAQRSTGARLRLVIAGQPDDTDATQEFVRRCLVHPDVLIAPRKVRTEDVQYYLRAADVGLAAYDRILNSGAAMLYQTFGLPVVVPDEPSVCASLAVGGHVTFSAQDSLSVSLRSNAPDSLSAALRRAAALDATAAVTNHIRRYDPDELSRALGRRLRAKLVGRAPREANDPGGLHRPVVPHVHDDQPSRRVPGRARRDGALQPAAAVPTPGS